MSRHRRQQRKRMGNRRARTERNLRIIAEWYTPRIRSLFNRHAMLVAMLSVRMTTADVKTLR